jgi:hypothetical protein
VSTDFADNQSFDRPVGLCEGVPPARGPFVMSTAFELVDPNNPPLGETRELPPPDPLPPCPTTCAAGSNVVSPRLAIGNLNTPPGDDKLLFRGHLELPHPFEPPLDPMATGVAIVVENATGTRLVDVLIPGGTYDPALRTGWRSTRRYAGWKYVNRSDSPPAGIRTVVIRDLSPRQPGKLKFRVTGRDGAYPIAGESLPLTGLFSVDPPTAETGQCGGTAVAGAGLACNHLGGRVICR